jgi:maltose alpha-D-glucosyltransferase/alpha-amylase
MVSDHDTDPLWFKDAVIYETHVRAFADSDGDGVGDFRGLTGKLDYLADLGVTALWLLPFYPSPLRDDGYDIADYDQVNDLYGTRRDFQRFVEAAHERDLKVITELVINHTSDQHPWFERAVAAPPGSPERDFYVWSDDPTRWSEARIIFQDFERSNWSWHPEAQAYYWHRFYHHQPDLNFDNPAVREALKEVLDDWASMGVDGMRLDAIPYLFERDGTDCENLPETHAYLQDLRAHLDANWPGRMFLAEANQWPEDAAAYFGDDDAPECHMNFHFPLMPRLYMATAMEDRFPIIDILEQTPEIPDTAQWAVFLRNHDELTLEMVTDEERDYMRRVYAADPRMRINLGIRRRLAPLLANDRRLIELMNALLFSLPGTPVLYYGDEIGMGDNVWLGDRDGVRTPMQWNGDRNAGFSTANPQQLFLPVVIDPEYHYETVNVEAQQGNPRSLWWWMKRTIALRSQHPVFGRGTIEFLHPDNPKVLAFVRSHEDTDVLVVANLSRHSQSCALDLAAFEGRHPVEMFGATPFPTVGEGDYPLTLGPHGFYWFQLERRPLQSSYAGASATGPVPEQHADPEITTTVEWPRFGTGGRALSSALPALLAPQRWFGGKGRDVRRTTVADSFALPGSSAEARLVIADVEYGTGDPDRYGVLLGFAAPDAEPNVARERPASRLADVHGRGEAGDGRLYDAAHDEATVRALVDLIRDGGPVEGRAGELRGVHVAGAALPSTDAPSRPLTAEQSNTTVRIGDSHVLKIVRRVQPGTNPDLEVGRFLTERAGFPHTPRVTGAVEMHAGRRDESSTLAILTEYVPNEGDAWDHALGAVGRYLDELLADPASLRVPGRSPAALSRRTVPEPVLDRFVGHADHLRLLGRRTAELHVALASDPNDPDFAPEEFTPLYVRSVYQHMRTRTRRAGRALERARKSWLPERVRSDVDQLLAREDEVLGRFQHLREEPLGGMRTRTHGDYHLGQVLWTGRDFQIIDFEGEPLAALSERRLKRSPLRDVAGMLRSFHYAAHVGARQLRDRGLDADTTSTLGDAARWWGSWAGALFLQGYLPHAPAQVLPPTTAEVDRLLDTHLLEKALYELEYELDNRPDWVAIPLGAVLDAIGPTT